MAVSSIRWRQQDIEKLKDTVRRFNAKIGRVAKKVPTMNDYLPDRVSSRELRETIKTRSDFNRAINSLNRFLRRGAEAPVTTEAGVKTTKYELREATIRLRTINLRRTLEREAFQKRDKSKAVISTMPSFEEAAMMPKRVNLQKVPPNKWNKTLSLLERQSRSYYGTEQSERYLENYLMAIDNVFGEKGTRIKEYAIQIGGYELMRLQYENPVLQIDFIYDPIEADLIVERIEETLSQYIAEG